jgi:NADH-quinone oxidoreductase subunit J
MHEFIVKGTTSPALLSAEAFVGLVFLVAVGVLIFGALVATNAKRLIRAVAGLALCFTGLAGIYYYLLSPFVAMMQLLIYVGAVSILIAFSIMLAEPEEKDSAVAKGGKLAGPLGLAVGFLFFAAFSLLGVNTDWVKSDGLGKGDILQLGKTLLTSHSMVFELISLVLLLAIVGSIVLARKGRS